MKKYRKHLIATSVVALVGCDALGPPFDDPTDPWVHVDHGYPFTAYLDPADSVLLPSGEWIDTFPEPAWLQPATARALGRWSRALSATETRAWIVPPGFESQWAPDVTPGDTLYGFHVAISFSGSRGNAGLAYGSTTAEDGRPVFGSLALNPTLDFSMSGAAIVIAHEIGHLLGFLALSKAEETRVLKSINEYQGAKKTGIVVTRIPMDGHHWNICMGSDELMGSVGNGDVLSALTIEVMRYEWDYRESDADRPIHIVPRCWRD